MQPVLYGLSFGLLLAVLVGPVFFLLLQTSIEKGFKKAILVAFGILLSDITYILLIRYGIGQLFETAEFQNNIAIVGGVILFLFGAFSIYRSRLPMKLNVRAIDTKGFLRFIFKGYAINALSPFVPLFWIATMSMATVDYGFRDVDLLLFFASVIAVVVSTDLLKAYLAGRLRSFVTPRLYKIMNILVGLVLMGFGIRMFLVN